MKSSKSLWILILLLLGTLALLFFLYLQMKIRSSSLNQTERPFAYGNSKIVRGINLGNALEAPNPGEWGVTIQPEYFSIIRQAGFDSVRIPVRFSAHAKSEAPFEIDKGFLLLVDEAVNAGLENGLIVILDLHHYEEFMADPQGQKPRFLAIWQQLGDHYQAASPNLYFELLNEPNSNLDAAAWNESLAEAVSVIRINNPQRKIIVGGIVNNDMDALQKLKLPDDKNILATFHFYEPFEFTHQGADWVEGADAWLGTTWQDAADEKKAIASRLDQAASWSAEQRIPLIMGEFGAINQADAASRQQWMEFVAREAEKRNIDWMYWEFCSQFGVYDCETRLWHDDLLKALIPE